MKEQLEWFRKSYEIIRKITFPRFLSIFITTIVFGLLMLDVLKDYGVCFRFYYTYLGHLNITMVISILTLIGLIWYIYYTYKIAKHPYIPIASINLESRMEQLSRIQTTSIFPLLEPVIIPTLKNHSKVPITVSPIILASINNNQPFFVDTQYYEGTYYLKLSPDEPWNGRFSISGLLKTANLTIREMEASRNSANYQHQLRFKVWVKCGDADKDKLRESHKSQLREYYYHFLDKKLVLAK